MFFHSKVLKDIFEFETSTFLSTFVGAVFAPTKFVRDICATFCLTIFIGCANALILLPAMLVLIPWQNPQQTEPKLVKTPLSPRTLSLSPRSPTPIPMETIFEHENLDDFEEMAE